MDDRLDLQRPPIRKDWRHQAALHQGPRGPPSTGRLAPTACFPDRQRVHCLPWFGAGAGHRPAVHPPSPLHVKRQFKTVVTGTSTIRSKCRLRLLLIVSIVRSGLDVFVMRCAWSSSLENQSWRKKAGDANVRLAFVIGDRRATPTVDRVVDLPDLTCVGVLLVMQKGPPGPRGTDAQPRPRRLGGLLSPSTHSGRVLTHPPPSPSRLPPTHCCPVSVVN